ncbi:MAG: iron-sulfur cluster assembly protein [Deltaproteobacteria bacterium]|nr:iron-sulfur cluster assembly protein [Deltaproteobacteria bacterium]
MATVKENDILEKLKGIVDPELGVNIVDLGLVYKVNIDEKGNVGLDMTLTAKGCPISGVIKYEVEEALKSISGVNDVSVNFVWEPEWNPSMIKEGVLKG